MVFPPLSKTIWQLLGPSIVFAALSLSGGEILLWPDLIGKFGLGILWPVPIILLLQFAVNLEIERYTITTGENILPALFRHFNWLRYLFSLGIVISLAWPAWVLTAGSMGVVILGLNQQMSTLVSMLLMFLISFIWSSSRSYFVVEKLTRLGLILTILVTLTAVGLNWDFNLLIPSKLQFLPSSSDAKVIFLSALAFGGVTGVLNLVQSAWVMKRQYGAAGIESGDLIDHDHPHTKKNWQAWWRMVKIEHFSLFYLGNIIGTVLVGLLAALTIQGRNLDGFAILKYQFELFNTKVFGLGYAWGLAITLVFLMAQIAILEAAGHLLKLSLPITLPKQLIKKSRLFLNTLPG